MEIIGKQIKETLLYSNITIADIPLTKIVLFVTIITLTQPLRGLFFSIVIKRIKLLTSGTDTTLDDELVEILEQPTIRVANFHRWTLDSAGNFGRKFKASSEPDAS
ncbi:hypothetical protein QUB05_23670 [Microcoleus sp. F10-C6]|uniref:hypothetical protein n=1 Tax=unclassified Microcoleus TaxID=2642155 RepID=UPI002FD4DF12